MFTVTQEADTIYKVDMEIPLNKTEEEILDLAKYEWPKFNKLLFQKHVKLASNIPPYIILYMAHSITHTTATISLLVGDRYIKCIEHLDMYPD